MRWELGGDTLPVDRQWKVATVAELNVGAQLLLLETMPGTDRRSACAIFVELGPYPYGLVRKADMAF